MSTKLIFNIITLVKMSLNIISNTGIQFSIRKIYLKNFDYFNNTFVDLDTLTEIRYNDYLYTDANVDLFIRCLKYDIIKNSYTLQQIIDVIIILDFHVITDEIIMATLFDELIKLLVSNKPFGRTRIPESIIGKFNVIDYVVIYTFFINFIKHNEHCARTHIDTLKHSLHLALKIRSMNKIYFDAISYVFNNEVACDVSTRITTITAITDKLAKIINDYSLEMKNSDDVYDRIWHIRLYDAINTTHIVLTDVNRLILERILLCLYLAKDIDFLNRINECSEKYVEGFEIIFY